jgi:hypothetical protein
VDSILEFKVVKVTNHFHLMQRSNLRIVLLQCSQDTFIVHSLSELSCIVLGYGLDDRRFQSRQRLGIFLFTTASRPAVRPTQPPSQWVTVALFLGVKRPGREADHLPPSIAEVKECVELHLHSFNTPSWCGTQLKHRETFTFTFTFIIAECIVIGGTCSKHGDEKCIRNMPENVKGRELGRPRSRREDNINRDLKEIGCEDVH